MVKQEVAQKRVAVVTGAGTGLGRAYAIDLARSGVRVIVNNRRREVDATGRGTADRVVAEIVAAGGEAIANGDDVCADGAGERIVQQALDTWGRLDVLVNNAGVDQHAAFHKIDLASFRAIFDINFFGTVQVTHAAWRHMREAGHGRIIVSTSSAGLHGLHGLSAYAASKAALIGLARSLAAEGAPRDVYCNAVAPYAGTRMTAAHLEPAERAAMAPELVAPLVTALCRRESLVNGQVIVAGCGWARRADTVESHALLDCGPAAVESMLASLDPRPTDAPGICQGFVDALAAYQDFRCAVTTGLRSGSLAG